MGNLSRRVTCALLAITVAGSLLRAQISSALVTRGDGLAYWGRQDAARTAYIKALFFDPRNGVAVDRYAFNAAMTSDRDVLRSCVVVASRYLAEVPADAAVMMDRALCFQHQGLLLPAIADFRRAGEAGRDARAFMFAALDEHTLRQPGAARQLLQKAVAVDPLFLPAQRELARI